nr:hypothetical protein [Ferrovum sp.]
MQKPNRLTSRTCNACGDVFIAPIQGDDRRHNCLTVKGGELCSKLPGACWQFRDHRFVRDVLCTVRAYPPKSKKMNAAHHKRVQIALDILNQTDACGINESNANKLIIKYGRAAMFAFIERLPGDSVLRTDMTPVFASVGHRYDQEATHSPTHRRPRVQIALPVDFEQAVQLYAEKSARIKQIKIRRGHLYSESTVRRRGAEARYFCEFLVRQGLQFWPEVSQHHLDMYVDETNRCTGGNAFTFLQFMRQNNRMTQRFIRPKIRLKPPAEAMLDSDAVPGVLRRIVVYPDAQVAVAALFLTLFGQMVARSAELRLGNFRERGEKLEALFAEEWTPLDVLTTLFLRKLNPSIGVTLPEQADTLLFTYPLRKLRDLVAKVVAVPLKPLRMTAIANIIRSGVTDRGAISRILGASMPTLAYIEKAFEWDLQMTVEPEIVKARNEVIRGERTE